MQLLHEWYVDRHPIFHEFNESYFEFNPFVMVADLEWTILDQTVAKLVLYKVVLCKAYVYVKFIFKKQTNRSWNFTN